jgi:hypothetical protein
MTKVACNGEKINAYKVLGGKLEEKKPLGSPRRRWKDITEMDLMDKMAERELNSSGSR